MSTNSGQAQTHGPRPEDIPATPERNYRDRGWAGMGDWLGTGTVHPKDRQYRSFRQAREFVRGLQLANRDQWVAYAQGALEETHGLKPEDIPAGPRSVYADRGWVSWGDWLGTGNVANQDREFRAFPDAREFVQALKLANREQWQAYAKGALEQTHGLKPEDIPAAPAYAYRGQGWVSWGDWLGTGNVANQDREFRAFLEAREFVRGLGLASQQEWGAYAKGALEETHGPRPEDIPATPERNYRDRGWAGMGDWLGTGTVATFERKFRSFEEAREFVRGLGLAGQKEWGAYCKGTLEDTHGLKPEDIPATPHSVYRDKGWVSGGDWLGTGTVAPKDRQYRSFRQARKFVRGLQLANRDQWKAYCKGALEQTHGLKPTDIPASPHAVYQDKGWAGYGDWLGTGKVRGGQAKRR